MNSFNMTGLWSLEESFALRMWGLASPRMKSGKEPFPSSTFSQHPAKAIGASMATAGLNVMAATVSYYDYVVTQYTVNGVAVIPIIGTLSRYGYCGWGYEDLAGMIDAANRQENVKAILLREDTPGGAVDGLRALADALRASKKPVLVWTNFCASAGYFLASQAVEIWLEDSPLPVMGSIGTLMVYTDQSGALKKAGLEVEIFRATESTDKATINGIEPLSEETRAEIQAMLDACQKEFAGYVRRGRAGLLKSDEWTSAKMYGVRDAIRIGLADKVGTLQQAIKRAAQLGGS